MAKKLMKITYLINGACCLLTVAATPLVLRIYSLSPEALSLGMTLIFIHNFSAMLIWPASFTLPNVLRAANDVRYPMICSIASMMILRLASGYLLGVVFQLGAIGIWISMVADWLCRAALFCAALPRHALAAVCTGGCRSRRRGERRSASTP